MYLTKHRTMGLELKFKIFGVLMYPELKVSILGLLNTLKVS
jgi:hypothetical protein